MCLYSSLNGFNQLISHTRPSRKAQTNVVETYVKIIKIKKTLLAIAFTKFKHEIIAETAIPVNQISKKPALEVWTTFYFSLFIVQ